MLAVVYAASRASSTRRLACRAFTTAPLLCSSQAGKRVLGCGSNVVDHIYNVKVVPNAGQKGFFLSPFKALEKKLIGGVTLNHLAWAALGGVPSGLLALQGKDDLGHFIRSNLKKLGVSTEYIKADDNFTTAQCHVFIQEDGERSIVMAPAATSLINTQAVMEHFDAAIQQHASIVTTEISQVPLTGVMAMLDSARRANVPSILDLDVPPSVAMNEARLGSIDEVIQCTKSADILKPAKAAAVELLQLMTGSDEAVSRLTHCEMAVELVKLCGSKLVAITNGEQPSILANREMVVEVAPPTVSKVVDTTGAGDAFLGGLIVALSSSGMPTTEDGMSSLGKIANAYGATCVQSVGGVPIDTSRDVLKQYLPEMFTSSTGADSEGPILSGFKVSLRNDIEGVRNIQERIDYENLTTFLNAVDDCQGQIIVSGVGKSGQVAQRLSGSLSSVGIPSHYVQASEWIHGDLGKAQPGRDVVLFISHSGNTEECVTAATHLVARGVTTLALTGGKGSKLGQLSMQGLCYDGRDLQEPFDCLPTTSLLLQEVLCNAILNELVTRRGITREEFKLNHPGGAIGTMK